MICSMTGFARVQAQGEWGVASCEIRSINHRYLELSVYLPDALASLEVLLRERIKKDIKRGKVECKIRYQSGVGASTGLVVNESLTKELFLANKAIAVLFGQVAPVSTMDVLRWPGVLQPNEVDLAELTAEVTRLVEKATVDLIAARAREGEELNQLFLQRLQGMQQEVNKVRERLPSILQVQRELLLKRFNDAQVALDPTRLEQEMVMYAQKIDVTEEMERLETHIHEIKRILKQGGLVGRRLDFLMQELNREANTLGSKSVDPVATHAAVELKVLIEQMREQVQNIE